MIKAEDLTKVFCTDEVKTWALDKVNTEINAGGSVTVMRLSGCGKFTLPHIPGLLDGSTSGKYVPGQEEVVTNPQNA